MPLVPLPTPSPASWKATQKSVMNIISLMDAPSKGASRGDMGDSPWVILHGLLIGHLPNMKLDMTEVAR